MTAALPACDGWQTGADAKKVEVVQLFLDFGDIQAKIVIIVGDILLGENTQVVLVIVTKEIYFLF